MSPQRQTLINTNTIGNCMMACYASYLDKNLSELPKIEKLFNVEIPENYWWYCTILFWNLLGYQINYTNSHEEAIKQANGDYYFAIGTSERDSSIKHMCIYKNGKLFHDPHPSDAGLIIEDYFEYVIKEKAPYSEA